TADVASRDTAPHRPPGGLAPRTWGWPWEGRRPLAVPMLPTHVGMVRWPATGTSRWPSAPHARGDGPGFARGGILPGKCSPRTWGWSGWYGGSPSPPTVLPTHVG